MAATKTSSAPAIRLGVIMGRVTRNTVSRGDAPEMRLASSRLGSIFSMAREMVMKA